MIEPPTSQSSRIAAAFLQIAQDKSDFQIHRFVVGQHDTPQRQYMQCVLQLQILVSNLRLAKIERDKTVWELTRARTGKRLLTALTLGLGPLLLSACRNFRARELQVRLDNLDLQILGWRREFEAFYKIFEELIAASGRPEGFNRAELQAAEPEYWTLRLARQAAADSQATGRVGQGNFEALWQADMLRGPHPGLDWLAANNNRAKPLTEPSHPEQLS